MKAAEFKEMLEKHDWYWRMSDSPVVAIKGLKEEKEILALKDTSVSFSNLYNNIRAQKLKEG